MPEMVFGLHNSGNGIYHTPGGLLVFRGDGLIVQECLEGLLVFALKHHFELFPTSLGLIGLLCINVEGFQVVKGYGVEGLTVLHLLGHEAELMGFRM